MMSEPLAMSSALGGACEAFACDVSDSEAVAGTVDSALRRFNRISVLVNNVGVVAPLAGKHTKRSSQELG